MVKMKINYEKILTNLKTSLFLLGDNFKNGEIKSRIRKLIVDLESISLKEKKIKKINKINTISNSVNPKKSIQIIDELIKKEKENEEKFNDYKEF
jgi:hypothetical protein